MLISTQTSYVIDNFDYPKAISILAKAGFDAVDFGLFNYPQKGEPFTLSDKDFDSFIRCLDREFKNNSLKVGQVHSPFATYVGEPQEDAYRLKLQEKSIRATAMLGCKYVVVHPAIPAKRKYDKFIAETKEINMKMYKHLLPFLKEYDVCCAIENMFSRDKHYGYICPTVCTTAEEMVDYIDSLESEHFVACLDVGHANLIHQAGYESVNPAEMVRTLGKRLKVLHVQDNNGIDDQHLAPSMGNIDWKSFCEALKEIGYDGTFSLEADGFTKKLPKAAALEGEKLLYALAKNLVDEYEL